MILTNFIVNNLKGDIMSIDILYELRFFVISIISGVILLVVYDFLRIIRRIIKHNDIIVFVDAIAFIINKIIQPFRLIIDKVKTITKNIFNIIYKRLNKCITWVKIRLNKNRKTTILQKEKTHEK